MFKTTTRTRLNLPRTEDEKEQAKVQSFLDMTAPAAVRFYPDHYICGSTYRSVWALRDYPTETSEQAILRHWGEKSGVTLRIYTRHVTPAEEKKIISNASNKNRMNRSNTNDLQQIVVAEANLQDVAAIVAAQHRKGKLKAHADELRVHAAALCRSPGIAELTALADTAIRAEVYMRTDYQADLTRQQAFMQEYTPEISGMTMTL